MCLFIAINFNENMNYNRAWIRHLVLLAMVLPGALISKGRNLVDQGGVVNGNVRNIGYSRTI